MGELTKIAAGGAGALFLWNSLNDGTKKKITTTIELIAIEVDRIHRDKASRQLQAGAYTKPSVPPMAQPLQEVAFPDPAKVELSPPVGLTEIASDFRWRELAMHPSVILILGKRGSGKSSLGYWLLEQLRTATKPYVIGLPESAVLKLPDWIGIAVSLEEVPPGSTILIDEAYIHFHARNSQTSANKELSQALNLSRQNDQTLIFVTQESRQVDKNLVSVANVVVFKEPSALQVEFERPEVRKIAEKAVVEFRSVGGDRREWSYVFAPQSDHAGLVKNQLPTFWSTGLSKAFGQSKPAADASRTRKGKKLSIPERRQIVHQKRADGWSNNQIAKFVGVSKATVIADLKVGPASGSD